MDNEVNGAWIYCYEQDRLVMVQGISTLPRWPYTRLRGRRRLIVFDALMADIKEMSTKGLTIKYSISRRVAARYRKRFEVPLDNPGTRQAWSRASSGRRVSAESRRKISERLSGRKLSESHKRALSKANDLITGWNPGKSLELFQLSKLSSAEIAVKMSISAPVACRRRLIKPTKLIHRARRASRSMDDEDFMIVLRGRSVDRKRFMKFALSIRVATSITIAASDAGISPTTALRYLKIILEY